MAVKTSRLQPKTAFCQIQRSGEPGKMSHTQIKNLLISENSVSWMFEGAKHHHPCSHESTATIFPSGQRILLIDRLDEHAPNNAIILSHHGKFIVRIINPAIDSICVVDCLSQEDSAIIVIAYKDRQLWCKVAEDGESGKLHEWR